MLRIITVLYLVLVWVFVPLSLWAIRVIGESTEERAWLSILFVGCFSAVIYFTWLSYNDFKGNTDRCSKKQLHYLSTMPITEINEAERPKEGQPDGGEIVNANGDSIAPSETKEKGGIIEPVPEYPEGNSKTESPPFLNDESDISQKTTVMPLITAEAAVNPFANEVELKEIDIDISNDDFDDELDSLRKNIQEHINSKPNFLRSQDSGDESAVDAICRSKIASSVWAVGDLHGDLKSLKLIIDFVHTEAQKETAEGKPNLLFLGDLIDDGPNSGEVAAWVMASSVGHSFQDSKVFEIMSIVGNHDIALKYKEGKFYSDVSPCDFKDYLNEHTDNDAIRHLGESLCTYFKRLPRMMFINDTVMAVHGAVPHTDISGNMAALGDITGSVNALNDITWGRLHERQPQKYPNRNARGHELGFKDFYQFLDKMAEKPFFGVRPRITLRGHDHFPNNYKFYDKYTKSFVLTITALSKNYRTSAISSNMAPVVAKWNPDDPNVILLYKLNLKTADSFADGRKA